MWDFFVDTGFKEIEFKNVGSQNCAPNHAYGPISQDKYLVHVILSGKGVVEVNKEKYYLGKKDYFFFKPDEITFYQADSVDPWHYLWFGFDVSKNFEYIVDNFHTVGKLKEIDKFLEFEDLIMKTDYSDPSQSIYIQSQLLYMMSIFFDNADNSHQQTKNLNLKSRENSYADMFCRIIKNNYWKTDLKISSVAENIGLNPSYFSSIIREELGMTPQEYLIDYRLVVARRYLIYTNQSVSQIAHSVGYQNINNFSRAYKKKYGHSPTYCRKFLKP